MADKDDEVLEVDPLTGNRSVAQTPTEDENLRPLPEVGDQRTGDYDETTGAPHPVEGSGADKGVEDPDRQQ